MCYVILPSYGWVASILPRVALGGECSHGAGTVFVMLEFVRTLPAVLMWRGHASAKHTARASIRAGRRLYERTFVSCQAVLQLLVSVLCMDVWTSRTAKPKPKPQSVELVTHVEVSRYRTTRKSSTAWRQAHGRKRNQDASGMRASYRRAGAQGSRKRR